MGYKETRAARVAAGLCGQCGGERVGEGLIKGLCAGCSAKAREYVRRYETRRRAERTARAAELRKQWAETGRCSGCGGKREGAFRLCAACRGLHRKLNGAARQRKRDADAGGVPGSGRVWSLGGAVPPLEGGARRYRVGLCMHSLDALKVLLARYKAGERAAGRQPRTHPVSHVVREAIRHWEKGDVPMPFWKWRLILVFGKVHVSLDRATWETVNRQAQARFSGSRSAALRAMVYYAAYPRVVGATGGRRRAREWREFE